MKVIIGNKEYKVVRVQDKGETLILCDVYGRETTKTLTEILNAPGVFIL